MGKEGTLLLLLGVFSLRICCVAPAASLNKSGVDEFSLLSIKAYINSDILASNWSKETSFCSWTGIMCGKGHPERVTALNLSSMGLHGTIAKEIGNLTFLRFLDMSNNSISGLIPGEIGFLRKLQGLNLSNNYLTGDIPTSLSGCLQLRMFDSSYNNLSGKVPTGVWSWSQLQQLSLSRNYFTGTVPPSIGNLSKLEAFDISENSFYGTVVPEMGQLSSLRILNLRANNLSGEVPQAIFNLSMLEFLSLRENNLSGILPFSIDKGLPNIRQIFLGNIQRRFDLLANQFHGKIPSSISNLSKLVTLDLSDNSFTHVPLTLGSLHQLQMLNLEANQLVTDLSNPEQDFLSSLASCKSLKFLQISFNLIAGVLPKSLGSSNLSESLETFEAFSCKILSPIPNEIGNLSSLLGLNLGYNHFTGTIPSTLGRLRSLRNLEIHGNRFHGSISPVLCTLDHLYSLNLATNNLSGQLPSCLGNLSSLREIYMSHNELNSSIASILWFHKGVSNNVKNLIALDLSWNQLLGEIPSTISQLENLVRLSLSRNKLKGRIVKSFTDLKDLQHLDLSHNSISGPIPKSLEALSHLIYFDVSFNELSGEIPDGGSFDNFTAEFFIGNKGLCGAPRFQVKKCKSLSKKKRLSYLSLLIVVVIGFVLILVRKHRVREAPLSETLTPYDYVHTCNLNLISYREIRHVIGNRDKENLIARGGIASVYLGRFPLYGEEAYAVKVFDSDEADAFDSFYTELNMCKSVRHRNLVKVVGVCSAPDFKALMMPYMPNGDLEKWLYCANCSLNFFERLRIMTDVAVAMEYLHTYHVPTIVHCDLNPKNILLDEDMVAHVGDFGIAKILEEDRIMLLSTHLGTIGYIAPEVGSEGRISTAADVYSYGILLIETLSRRKPTDEKFSVWRVSMRDFVLDIVEDELMNTEENIDQLEFRLTEAVKLARECLAFSPMDRPPMTDVAIRIAKIYSYFKNVLDSLLA
ncbi:hypothetical protein C2S51_018103 [Perilla frutescens var. frutescens]|nr:hypothetical protein C2S51_018103 [Perilla frutescens var. frutescens]